MSTDSFIQSDGTDPDRGLVEDLLDSNQNQYEPLIRDFRCAMLGCAAFFVLFLMGMFVPNRVILDIGLTADTYGVLCRSIEAWGCYVCMIFGTAVAFRLHGMFLACVLSACLCSPLVLGSMAGIMSVIAFLVITNDATKRLRNAGYRLSFTGRATKIAESTAC